MRYAIVLLALTAVALADAPKVTPQLRATGKAVYEGNAGCHACHGMTGEGNGPVAFALKPPPRNLVKDPFKAGDSPQQVFDTLTKGLANTRMVGYPTIPEADRWALTYYVLSLRGK